MDEVQDTRQRLLETACEVFAEKGYRGATVHDLCSAAKANVAAVNYYFGSKRELYLAVWQHLFDAVRQPYVETIDAIANPVQHLRELIAQRVSHVFDDGAAGRLRRVTHREMHDPTEVHAEIRERFIRPNIELVERTVAEILDLPADDPIARRCAFSVHSQLVSLARLRMKPDPSPLQRLLGGTDPDPAQTGELADHLVTFVLGGLRATMTSTEPSPETT